VQAASVICLKAPSLLLTILGTARMARIAILTLASIAAAGCSGLNAPANGPAPAAIPYAAAAAAGSDVNIVNSAYVPKTLRAKAGVTVRRLNKDDISHTVSADDGSFTSSFLTRNHAFKHTFAKPGKYPYHCKIHPYMTGTVIVTK
jgi:plastocyanin